MLSRLAVRFRFLLAKSVHMMLKLTDLRYRFGISNTRDSNKTSTKNNPAYTYNIYVYNIIKSENYNNIVL